MNYQKKDEQAPDADANLVKTADGSAAITQPLSWEQFEETNLHKQLHSGRGKTRDEKATDRALLEHLETGAATDAFFIQSESREGELVPVRILTGRAHIPPNEPDPFLMPGELIPSVHVYSVTNLDNRHETRIKTTDSSWEGFSSTLYIPTNNDYRLTDTEVKPLVEKLHTLPEYDVLYPTPTSDRQSTVQGPLLEGVNSDSNSINVLSKNHAVYKEMRRGRGGRKLNAAFKAIEEGNFNWVLVHKDIDPETNKETYRLLLGNPVITPFDINDPFPKPPQHAYVDGSLSTTKFTHSFNLRTGEMSEFKEPITYTDVYFEDGDNRVGQETVDEVSEKIKAAIQSGEIARAEAPPKENPDHALFDELLAKGPSAAAQEGENVVVPSTPTIPANPKGRAA